MLSLFLLAPLAGLILLNLPIAGIRRLAPWLGMSLALLQVLLVAVRPESFWRGQDPLSSVLHLGSDNLALVLLASIGIVMFVTFLIGRQTISEERERSIFYSLLLVAMVGMNGTVLLSDLFTLYVFIEVTSVASFVLIALHRGVNALEGAFKYLLLSAVATVMMISAVALLLMFAGGTSFTAVGAALAGAQGNLVARMAVGIFVCGLLIKGGVVPFHGWLPAAYSTAPAAVSVFLAGIATKVSGVYALIRLMTTVFAGQQWLGEFTMLVAGISIVVGALAALRQDDLKRMLAYSSISQVGYIILGLGCFVAIPANSTDIGLLAAKELALMGAVFHLFNHAIFKSLLFVNSASLEQRLGTTDLNRMEGLGSRMPLTGVTSVIASLSTAGVPPLAGFWSKLIIVIALWKANRYGYATVAVAASVLTLAYFLTIQRRVFFGKVREEFSQIRETGAGLAVAAVVLASITIGVGVAFPYVLGTYILPLGK